MASADSDQNTTFLHSYLTITICPYAYTYTFSMCKLKHINKDQIYSTCTFSNRNAINHTKSNLI